MINKEIEYRKIFMNHKKWARHCTRPSSIKTSSTLYMLEGAKKTLNYILNLESLKSSFVEKMDLLHKFYIDQDVLEKNKANRMGSDFYFNCLNDVNRAYRTVASGKEVVILKLGRR